MDIKKREKKKIFSMDAAGRVPVIILLALVILLNARAWAGEPEGPPAPGKAEADLSKPVALVNGVQIRALDLKKAMQERIPETGHQSLSQKRLAEIRGEVLNTLINQEILFQEAKRLKVEPSSGSIEAEIQKIQSRFKSKEEYRKSVKAQGLTPDQIREGVERYLAIRQLTDQEVRSKIDIGDDQMKSYYDGHRDQFKLPEQVRLRILLVGVDPSGLSEDWGKSRQKAQELADRAKKGEAFDELVRQFSDEAESKVSGGDTGLLHRGRLPYAELESTAYTQAVGSISDPIRTLYGYIVFRVEEKKPAQQLAFENLNKDLFRKEMQESAAEAKFKEWIDGLRSRADIKIY